MTWSFSTACGLCLGIGLVLGKGIDSARALSCAQHETWELTLVSVEGPDSETDDVWPQSILLKSPHELDVWGRDVEGSFPLFDAFPEESVDEQ